MLAELLGSVATAAGIMLVVAYLLGSIPFAFLLVRWSGRGDVRTVGSGNVGATNAMRAAGWKPALVVAIGDVGKGIVAVLAMRFLATANLDWVAAAGLVAVIGHCFPVWLAFRGGKGVATAAGVFFAIAWQPALVVAVVFFTVAFATRWVSVASVAAAAAFPLALILLCDPTVPVMICAVAAAILIIMRHRLNFRRLVRGEEPKLGRSKK